jgi:D-glycero-D-manno-heptose 1,7-bisphosphate phosphatase
MKVDKKFPPAIFLDRDGTLNIDYGYVYKIKDFHFIHGVYEALRELKNMGYLLILVTNQSGIARGIFTEDNFLILSQLMNSLLLAERANIDRIYFCPHLRDAPLTKYRKDCSCRKPRSGMFLISKREFNINMTSSYMIGDSLRDLVAANAAGVGHTILVGTGKPITMAGLAIADKVVSSISAVPKYIKHRLESSL